MNQFALIFLFFTYFTADLSSHSMQQSMQKKYHYLAVGDSYTIGEKVKSSENFPSQVFAELKDKINIEAPRIIATTGWTTDELEAGIAESNKKDALLSNYDFVTLLIGVNNQYRGRDIENYKTEFEELLKKAIQFAGNRNERVIVLSIPDWGVTPFAEGRDREKISEEIDMYNRANQKIAEQYNIYYINITPWTREASNDPSLLAEDGLHPSGKEYHRWAQKIASRFLSII
ncbi:MAG TPA: SGNH/GDSL hydrolase family protein [Chitinophagaceae bacterium]|nr:SGNH/GDSL hydrolase family protein [Chitinophagaceae bacterium]